MCGGGGSTGPTREEKEVAVEQRVEADYAQREVAEDKATAKREDIEHALSARSQRQGKRGGKGRRSLFKSSKGAAGYASRFD